MTTMHSTQWNSRILSCINSKKKIGLILLIMMSIYMFMLKFAKPIRYIYFHDNIKGRCIMPDLDPYDEEIMKLDWHPDPIKCAEFLSLVYVDQNGFVRYNYTAIHLSKLQNIQCSYSLFERIGDDELTMLQAVPFTEPVYVPGDVFAVKCVNKKGTVVYDNLHQNINFRKVLASKTLRNETEDTYSVYMFGVDSVSRLAAIRKLPKTMKFLEEELGAFTFKGFTKVGENTFPNVIPMVTGRKAYSKELPIIDMSKEYFDEFPFVWKNYSKAGYVTLLAEDWPEISAFNYVAKGFHEQPCDHYLRPFYLAMLKVKPLQYYVDQVSLFLENKNIKLKKMSSLCYGNRPKHVILIDFYKRFIDTYKGKLKFAFSWLTEIAHDYQNFLELADEDFFQFFQWLKREGHLDRAVVLFLSDHGSRIDEIRNTATGRVEVLMPVVSLLLPETFKKKYPNLIENVKNNTNVLTAPYDVYFLLSDILNKNFNVPQFAMSENKPRGISLLRQIPETRTCADAAIPENYCACYSSAKINVTDSLVKTVASFLVRSINNVLKNVRDKCAELNLSSIKSANMISSGFKRIVDKEEFSLRNYFTKPPEGKTRYQITYETIPGHALFEGTVDMNEGGEMNVLGDISRTNRYGNQSLCVTNRILKLYCFCK